MTHRPEEDIAMGDPVSMRCSRWDTGVGGGLNLYHCQFWYGIYHGEAMTSSRRHYRGEEQQGGHPLGESAQLAAVLAPRLKDLVKTSVRKFDTLIKVCYFAGAVSNCGSRHASG